ncbi:hypothetical protein ACTXT7_004152 [Hymenolepis weldensis]
MSAKGFLKKLKNPEEQDCPWFSSHQKYFHQDEEVNRRNDRVNADEDADGAEDGEADADARVETLQTIVVKSPWLDSVANGGRPYVLQQDSPSSHEALNTQNWKDGREFSSSSPPSSCHPNLRPPPNSPYFAPSDYQV